MAAESSDLISNAQSKEYVDDLVSIVTPLYNAEKYIKATALSVLSQTFGNFEWYVINDCSKDNSVAILNKIVGNDPRVHVINLPRNVGPIVARNHGFRETKGRFLAFIDADDLWTPKKLAKQVAFMKARSAVLSFTGYRKIYDDGSPKSRFTIPVPKKASYNRLLSSNSVIASSVMIDRRFVGDIRQDETVPVSKDDLHLWLSILARFPYAHGLTDDLCRFRIHRGSITSNKNKAARLHWVFYREYMELGFLESTWRFVIYAIKGFVKYLI